MQHTQTFHNAQPLHNTPLTTPHACSTGTQSFSLSQGVYEAAGRRYTVVWKMLNEVLIIAIVPSSVSATLTAQRVAAAVAQLLLIYCKSAPAVTMDKIFRKYVQVCC